MRYSTLLIAIGMSLVIYYTLKKWTGLPNVESEKSKWYFRIMPIALLGIALYLSVRCMDMPYIAMWKRICILGILWGIAYDAGRDRRYGRGKMYLASARGAPVLFG